jgi:MoxR-like ATPase
MSRAVVGQQSVIDQILVALISGGHVLLEGVPGTAKTLTVRTLATVLQVSFTRIQFTPDLMPADIVGTSVFNPAIGQFAFKPGPLFAGFVLADEINRTPPKTQAALLEAMEERTITVDGATHTLPSPFMVLATQNPIEYEGTYPLPEAQLDRFMLKIDVGYPSEQDETIMVSRVQGGFRSQDLNTVGIRPVYDSSIIRGLQAEANAVRVEPSVQKYVVQIVRATRSARQVQLGASPRASVTLLLAAKALAAIRARDYVTPDDVYEIAAPALRHRIILRPDAELEGHTGDNIVRSVLDTVDVPR